MKLNADNEFDTGAATAMTNDAAFQLIGTEGLDLRGRDGPLIAQLDIGAGNSLAAFQITKSAFKGGDDIVIYTYPSPPIAASAKVILDVTNTVCYQMKFWGKKTAGADTTARVRGSGM